jgi:LmbE family N-acetylglucosaminyl deacetylase
MTNGLYDQLLGDEAPLPTPASVLTIGAHPDDAEFGAGATLARWRASGARITILVVTDGSKGSWDPDVVSTELIAAREMEQTQAATAIGGAATIHLGYVDGDLEYSLDLRDEIAAHIRKAAPDVVLTHDPWQRYQLHPDHRVTGLLGVDAVVAAREPLAYRESGLTAHRPGALLLWSADEPNHAEPITPEWFDRKVEALLCHSSQGSTTMGDAGSSAERRVEFIDRLALWHAGNGEAFGIGPAESFRKIVP